MKLLILGGTQFVGRHLTETALAAGHEVTLFHRGKTNPDLFPNAEHLYGDRDGQLEALHGRSWDSVVDVNGYVPRIVRQSAELLRDAVPHYLFISTISVYSNLQTKGQDEDASLETIDDPTVEEITGESYGPLKVLCEQVVQETYSDAACIIRPSLVAGPYDPSDRFTYWPHRAARGGPILVPSKPEEEFRFIDARDLAEWTLHMAEEYHTGVFNAINSSPALTMGRLLEECLTAAQTDARPVWVAESFLLAHEVAPWSDLPLWLPQETTDEYAGVNSLSNTRAVAAGLTFRTLAETVRDTLAWDRTRPADTLLKAGLAPEREQELLDAWAAHEH